MPRPRERVCLQDGLKLDLNRLCKMGLKRNALSGPFAISWNHSYWGELASAKIRADMSGEGFGWLSVQIEGGIEQRIVLIARRRNFGGRQWYFICPVTGGEASVLWRPSGATRFCSRKAWGRQVAYQSQFSTPDGRAHLGQAKIKSRLIGDLDPDDWALPPKPKWMRLRTYNRYEDKFDRYETLLDSGIACLAAKWGGL